MPTGGFALGQPRVENLMRVTAAVVAAYVQSQLHGVDLWGLPFAELKGTLIGASQVGGCACARLARAMANGHAPLPRALRCTAWGSIPGSCTGPSRRVLHTRLLASRHAACFA